MIQLVDKDLALFYANELDTNDLMANRMGIHSYRNHYEVWHVVPDTIPTTSMDGIPRVRDGIRSLTPDGGQDYTNDGPVWVEDVLSFADLMVGAMEFGYGYS